MAMTRAVRKSEIAHNVKARRDSRPALTKEGIKAYDEMTLEEVKRRGNEQLQQANFADPENQINSAAHQKVFLEAHPELWEGLPEATAAANMYAIGEETLRTPEGITLMRHAHRTMPESFDFEMALDRLKRKGTRLVFSQGVLARKRLDAVRAQVAEGDPETMPMDELRRRANGVSDPLGPQY
jgi:hypothetical protein